MFPSNHVEADVSTHCEMILPSGSEFEVGSVPSNPETSAYPENPSYLTAFVV